jgi:hypothetical protein
VSFISSIKRFFASRQVRTFRGLLTTLLLAAGVLWWLHGNWLLRANEVMLSGSPDGFKNYLTSAWHVQHDTGATHYGGMSYPYGEHVLFTDNQPLLSTAMQWWNRHISNIGDKTVGLVNIFQVLSILLGCGILYVLLRKLHLPVWYATFVTLGMIFLSPQQARFEMHFGLSHTWIFVLLLLLLCRYEERQSKRYQSLLIGILVWVAAQFHFYYLGLAALFLGLYTLYQWVSNPTWRNIWSRTMHLTAMVLLPYVLLNVWIQWSDFATDRPAYPYGFTSYIGRWEGVFLPYENFKLYQWIDRNIVPIRRIDTEAMAYAGLLCLLFTGWAFYRRFRIFDAEWEQAAHHRVHKRYLGGIFTAALLLLIFACGFPFAIDGMEWMVDYMGPLRQFRGLGRFTWAYFYTCNIVLFYVLWHKMYYLKTVPAWFQRLYDLFSKPNEIIDGIYNLLMFRPYRYKPTASVTVIDATAPAAVHGEHSDPNAETATDKEVQEQQEEAAFERLTEMREPAGVHRSRPVRIFITLTLLSALTILLYEAAYFQDHKRPHLQPNAANRNVYASDPGHWLNKVDFSGFQAVLPLPYYHIGSENIWLDFDGAHYPRVMSTAFHTGLPDMGVNMSRTARAKMLNSVQLAYIPGEVPGILEDLPNNRPIALLVHPPKWEEVQKKYPHLLANAKMVYEHPELKILSVSPDEIRSYAVARPDTIKARSGVQPLYPAGRFWQATVANTPFAYQSYDSLPASRVLLGGGSYTGSMADTTRLFKVHLPKGVFMISMWIDARKDMGMTHELRIREYDRRDGHEVHFGHEGIRFYLKSVVDGWALVEIPFEVYESDSVLDIWLHKKGVKVPFTIDECLIRPQSVNFYRETGGRISENNLWYQ